MGKEARFAPMIVDDDFPRLTSHNHHITSPADHRYRLCPLYFDVCSRTVRTQRSSVDCLPEPAFGDDTALRNTAVPSSSGNAIIVEHCCVLVATWSTQARNATGRS